MTPFEKINKDIILPKFLLEDLGDADGECLDVCWGDLADFLLLSLTAGKSCSFSSSLLMFGLL